MMRRYLFLVSAIATFAACDTGEGEAPSEIAAAQAETGEMSAAGSVAFEQAVAGGAADPVATAMASLQGEATEVMLSADGSTLLGRHPNGTPFGILTDQKSRAEWAEVTPADGTAQKTGAATDDGIVCNEQTWPGSKTACIVSVFDSEFQQDRGSMQQALTRAGYTPKTFGLATAQDVGALRDALPTCGVLYISSHGDVQKNLDGRLGNHITTAMEVTGDANSAVFQENLVGLIELFGGDFKSSVGVVGHKGKAYWTLSPDFFASVSYPNTLVYIDACHGGRTVAGGQTLARAFRDKGAGAFIGWNGAISTRFSNPAADAIFSGLAPQVVSVDSVTLSIEPPDPGPTESYVPSVTVSPAQANAPVRLTVSGTDAFYRTETGNTDAAGKVTFAAVPGGAEGVVDTITAVVGGADASASVVSVVTKDPTLAKVWKLPWKQGSETLSSLVHEANEGFNLVCANAKLTETTTVVKF